MDLDPPDQALASCAGPQRKRCASGGDRRFRNHDCGSPFAPGRKRARSKTVAGPPQLLTSDPSITVEACPLTPEDRRQLELWAKEKTAPARLVERARMLLLLADGIGIRPAARHLHVGLNTIRRWRDRFLDAGCPGLEHDAPGRGRKPVLTVERKAEIVRMTTQEKP